MSSPSDLPTNTRPPTDAAPHRIAAEQLLQGRRSVEIAYNGQTYRLLATKNGKLILQK